MKLVLTGGGTGGHIYPALEVGRAAAEQGAELHYFGSFRGQEARLCTQREIPFQGFASEPLYSLRTPRGWKALAMLLQARNAATKALFALRPDVVFSTGGYSAGPVVAAARRLSIPYVIHEGNSAPGRSNRLFARHAHAFATVFHATEKLVDFPVIRTGMPIRKALREAAATLSPIDRRVLVVGGSQGSAFLNGICPQAARRMQPPASWRHSTGPANLEAVQGQLEGLADYEIRPYFEADAMAEAYRTSSVAVGRSGGTLAEFALFRLPSVVVPLPSAADNHQMHNASEFVSMGAATCLPQADATPGLLAEAVESWLSPERRAQAGATLATWDVPDATERIVALVLKAAGR